ncbi:MAG: 50S ribosomal protein L18e [Nanoarchaeota archaeon]|nr:50S ribosomal protein L18e [Nanoarchaeota archaeon]
MKISKSRIEKRLQKKANPRLKSLIILLKKQKTDFWLTVAKELSKPKRKSTRVNLFKIDKIAKTNDTLVIPGKVLSYGDITKQVKIAAFSFSEEAKRKLKLAGCKIMKIDDLIKNPEKNMRIIK